MGKAANQSQCLIRVTCSRYLTLPLPCSNFKQFFSFQESKRAFFYSIVTEGGDKEKLEAFVNFCEDAIFEMTHASALMDVEDSSGSGKTREAAYSYIADEEDDRLVDLMRNYPNVPAAHIKNDNYYLSAGSAKIR